MGMSKYQELLGRVKNYLEAQDWETAYSLVKNGDASGDANATAILAEFYVLGLGVPEDVETGIELWKSAISRGCSEAAVSLALLYYNGEKIPPNEDLAFRYMQKGAELGDPEAMGKLASMYMDGKGTNVNMPAAIEWAQKAAKLGDLLGMENLAVIYDDGIGVYRDAMQAAHWYRECLQRDEENTFYMYRLAVCLSDPFEVFDLNPDYGMLEEAYSWACRGVEKGDLDCHMLVAWFYEVGNVVKQDYEKAYKYFKLAADNGHEESAELVKRYRRNIFGNYYLPQ